MSQFIHLVSNERQKPATMTSAFISSNTLQICIYFQSVHKMTSVYHEAKCTLVNLQSKGPEVRHRKSFYDFCIFHVSGILGL